MDYKLVIRSSSNPGEFVSDVAVLLANGWIPLGGVSLQTNGCAAQAFVLEEATGKTIPVVSSLADYLVTELSGTAFILDTATAARTLTLPASPSVGHFYYAIPTSGTFSLFVDPNGKLLQGGAAPVATSTITTGGVQLIFDGASWWFT